MSSRPTRLCRSGLIAVSLTLIQCTTPGAISVSPQKNDNLIQSWSTELQKQEPYAYPFVANYKKGNAVLTIVAAESTSDPNSATFSTIRKLIDRQKFDLVVTEGFPRSMGISPNVMFQQAAEDAGDGFKESGEQSFAVFQARKIGAAFMGIEPDQKDIVEAILKQGYSREDLLFFHIVRLMPQWRRSKDLKPKKLPAFAEKQLKPWLRDLGIEKFPKWEEFLKWYEEKNKVPFQPEKIVAETVAPIENSELYTQRMASVVSKFRDVFMINAVAAEFANYSRILIVYGGSHWIAQSKAWSTNLGSPTIEKIQ